jgi:hypothetical protein
MEIDALDPQQRSAQNIFVEEAQDDIRFQRGELFLIDVRRLGCGENP